MSIYAHSATQATKPAPRPSSAKHRDSFARDAVFTEFRPRDARALGHDGFKDRRPNDGPRHIGEVAAGVVQDVGDRALRHWLAQAAQAETYEDRAVALEIASEIARLAGIDINLPELDAA